MHGRAFLAIAAVGLMLAAGCPRRSDDETPRAEKVFLEPPVQVAGTVAEYAVLSGTGWIDVQGYGVVIGLGENGSTAMPPPAIQEYLTQYLSKVGLGSYSRGLSGVQPVQFLRDPDTAVVLIAGSAPVGAPKGSAFDVFVRALPGTQTRSLDGGVLMSADLHIAVRGEGKPGGETQRWATASGCTFVNPYLDPSRSEDLVKLQEGRVLGGGRLVESRPIRLRLRQPDRARSVVIARRINERFPQREPTANALNPGMVELTVPPDFVNDTARFLELVLHLPLRSDAASLERKTRELVEAMRRPGSPHRELAMVLEAIGRECVPQVQTLYSSEAPAVAFHAAMVGMRLGDAMAQEIVLRFAGDADSSLQADAVEELGRNPAVTRAVPLLRQLVDSPNERVRVAAYEALRCRRDRQTVQELDVGGRFRLHLVSSHRGYVVYATQTDQPTIVLFGKDMRVRTPLFFTAPDDLVTLDAPSGSEELALFRKVPRTGKLSDRLKTDFYVRSIVQCLGSNPEPGLDGQFAGLGLTYSQVVGVLHRMCQRGDIPAKFVLQPSAEIRRLYDQTSSTGRPD